MHSDTIPGQTEGSASRNPFPPDLTAGVIFLAALALSALIIWRSEIHRLQIERARVSHIASDHAATLRLNIERALSATYSLAALVRQGKGNITDFDAVASGLLPFFPGVSSLQLAPGGVVRDIVPLTRNEGAIGHDLLHDRNTEAFLARDTGKLTLAGPFNLIQGGVGAVGRLPVFLDDAHGGTAFWGFTIAVIRFPDVLETAALSGMEAQGITYELWRIHPGTGQKQIIAASQPASLADPVDCTLKLPNGIWTLSVMPSGGWGDAAGLTGKISSGFLLSLLLFFLARFQLNARLETLRITRQLTRDLRENENVFESVIKAMAEGVYIQWQNGEITAANPAAEKIFGPLTEQTSVFSNAFCNAISEDGTSFPELLHPSLLALSAGQPQHDVVMGIHGQQGDVRWISINAQPLIAEGETIPYAAVTTFHDITERTRAEAALKKSEQKFKAIFDHTFQFIGLMDINGIMLDANRSALEFSGIQESEVIGKLFWETPWWSHSGELQEQLRSAIKKAACGEFIRFEVTHPDRLGNLRAIDFSLKPVWDEAGAVVMIIPEGRDITSHKHAEAEIRSLNQQLEQRVQERTVELHQKNIELSMEVHERKLAEENLRTAQKRLEETNRALETLSITDHLTGLANRRYFDEALEKEHARHARSGAALSMIMLDIDFFKLFNDSYGHLRGDDCLQKIAGAMEKCAGRAVDIVARYGGEEFSCILPETNLDGAIVIAEKIRAGIQGLAIPHDASSVADCVTASLGVVTITCTSETSPSRLIDSADTLLYKAKLEGRNRVEAGFIAGRLAARGGKNPFQLEWKDIYCSGNTLIDSQHQNFFHTSNQFLNALQSSLPNAEILLIVEQLLEDIVRHFRDEEAILKSVDFPGLKEHAEKHAVLHKKGSEMALALRSGSQPPGEIFTFLVYDVVFQHMYLADREYFPFLGKDPAHPQ